MYKLKKALYGLKQAPRAWYDRLKGYLLRKGFTIGNLEPTFFILHKINVCLIVQIYVDDIIFGSTNESLSREFVKDMQDTFKISLIRELKYFLGL